MRTQWVLLLSLLGGCATAETEAEVPPEELPDPALTDPSCATTHPDHVGTGGIDPALDIGFRFAANYCADRGEGFCGCTDLEDFQGAVVDIVELSPEYISGLPGSPGSIRVEWADVVPTEQAACERTEVIAQFFRRAADGSWELQHAEHARGSWESGGFFEGCTPPGAAFTDLEAGASYRVALTAVGQTADGQNYERFKAIVLTRRPVIIH